MSDNNFLHQPPTPENLRRIGWRSYDTWLEGGTDDLIVSFDMAEDRFWIIDLIDDTRIPLLTAPATMGDLIAGLRFLGIPCEVQP